MANFITSLFSTKPKVDYEDLIHNGAIIIDVRTKGEYQTGHIEKSINIPLDTLLNSLSKLSKDKCIICCCASGMRSASAKSILQSKGFTEVHNAGAWTKLQAKIG